MALAGILLALGLLIWLAYRGISVLILAPIMAALAAAFSAMPLMATYSQVFMPAAGAFVVTYFPLFLLGAVFGRLMDRAGFARAIADGIVGWLGPSNAIPAVVMACAFLTYGGVSLFVVVFAIYPIAAALFQAANIPKRLMPATIALGAFTFTMTALPGTPAIQNAIPMPVFGTTPFASPGLGMIAAVIMAACGWVWLTYRARRLAHQGYHGAVAAEVAANPPAPAVAIRFAWAIFPILCVIAANYVFSVQVFPRLDTSYLALPEYGATTIDTVRGIWSITLSLIIAILLVVGLGHRNLTHPTKTMGRGAEASLVPIFNTASLVGFGAVVAGLPAFALVQEGVDGLGGGPVVALAISTSVLAGLTGSASGGMSIALDAVGASYLEQAIALGISPDLLHRVTTVATGGLDALPHNGAVVTLLSICKLTHRESYGDLFMVAVLVPVLALVTILAVGLSFGSF
ncbi:GntP family permease [Actibacterium sp. 188UL27-1]|nr:GntP family permease [Actibacterium sp. 188UL27-1]